MTEPVTAAERAVALDVQVSAARGEVARLERAVAAAEQRCADARRAVDIAAAQAADQEAAQLRADLGEARGALGAWEAAHREVSAQRAREGQAAELAALAEQVAGLEADLARAFADVAPALDVTVERIERADELEAELHVARSRAAALQASVDGAEPPRPRNRSGPMSVALERNPLLRDLRQQHQRGWNAL